MKLVLISYLCFIWSSAKIPSRKCQKRIFFRFFPRHTQSIDFSHSLLLPHIWNKEERKMNKIKKKSWCIHYVYKNQITKWDNKLLHCFRWWWIFYRHVGPSFCLSGWFSCLDFFRIIVLKFIFLWINNGLKWDGF